METIVKAFKFIGGVNTYIGDMLDFILTMYTFFDKHKAFLKDYFHEHPDEIDDVYSVIKYSDSSFSFIQNRERFSNDQEPEIEIIVKKKKDCNQEKMTFLYRDNLIVECEKDEEDEKDEDEDEEDEKQN